MGKGREIRCFDYVNHPYRQVRDALTRDPQEIFNAATSAAASRAQKVASQLRVNIGGIEVGTEIAISVKEIEEQPGGAMKQPLTRLELEWEAEKRPGLFPFMRAELSIYPLTATETQLDLRGRYDPPLGLLGDAVDAVAGRRIADASVHRFLNDVADYLRRTLTK